MEFDHLDISVKQSFKVRFRDIFFIKGIDDQALIDVLVMNEAGQLEQKTQLSYPFKLETSGLPSGVYTLLLLGAEGNNTSLKMVKN